MCGIVGYIGERDVVDVLLDGMRRMEYRGYDSAGMALLDGDRFEVVREIGRVAELEKVVLGRGLTGRLGIGHTRWATHGGVTVENAHPQSDGSGRFVLVHNGIIENYLDLKEELEAQGDQFLSQTDTEVVVHYLARLYSGDMLQALVELQKRLRGSYALVILRRDDPDGFFCVRRGSPLVLGSGEGENFCVSDVAALLPYTRKVLYLEEGDIAQVSRGGLRIWDEEGTVKVPPVHEVDWDVSMVDKGGYSHFMLKEINEQGAVVRSSLKGRIEGGRVDLSDELQWTAETVASWRSLHIVACGTSYYASLVAERALSRWTDLDVRVDIASEYRHRTVRTDAKTLAVFVSQSGETADTIAAQRVARGLGAHCLAITNVRGSTLAREVHDTLLLKAGPEIGVAATKTFMGQMSVLYLLALYLGRLRGGITAAEESRLVEELNQLPYKVEATVAREESLSELARIYAERRDFLFLGRGYSFPVALEGALKLKEISYVHAEGYAAGEMKHGPIALLDEKVPVITVIPRDSLYEKTLSNILEAKARKSPIIALGTDGDDLLKSYADHIITVPWTDEAFTPFLTVIPLQLFAYHVAKRRGCDIDKPRNLAKSVTVE
ncbi:glutamine--fructose-6-phosphate transaminase (isomerizing) [Aminithiophilus ramosus]|uniref:Glutamine--fructose-6-phosphate aminotransferase [isomerizing] n=2 Tax=Synergistales TaxID=649776 RepID=A0A9Q7AKP6_9BACT|nr:glutamine--fructose-6-phosphate transaminase (isomerizing) [Aminithiophilus ramosus]QTX31288.1 glutamine--fructose-6-phosphate transaminase (isomerizing) [Aminithiophilus ramosus]QVL35088.1 glutamine--fructose-6-phosphate transaminase (isomerizing) [Synergistota bacterium]